MYHLITPNHNILVVAIVYYSKVGRGRGRAAADIGDDAFAVAVARNAEMAVKFGQSCGSIKNT